jgi:hypothetical protein
MSTFHNSGLFDPTILLTALVREKNEQEVGAGGLVQVFGTRMVKVNVVSFPVTGSHERI